MRHIAALLLLLTFCAGQVSAGERGPITPTEKEKCPVCGMFVKKYPDWVGQVLFKDGSHAVFDGAKDLFKYYLNPKKYNPGRTLADIDSIYVTDYYRVEPIDAYKALYVIGSDMYGPMGKELIPFANAQDAKGFMKDHKGRAVLTFTEVTLNVLKGLD